MKKLLLLVLFSVIFSGVHAQRNRITVEERAKRNTEWMKNELNLSEEQIPPVDSINLLFTKAQHVLMQNEEGNREKIREALTALDAQKTESLKTVLTSDQLETYKKKSEEMRNNRNRGGRRGR